VEELQKLRREIVAQRFPYNVVLTGFMGSGKTAVGFELARMLEIQYQDCDSVIEIEAGMSVGDIFESYGESYFRLLEQDIIQKLSRSSCTVISCGGGAVMNAKNVTALKKNGILVFLKATPAVIYGRIKNDSSRPLLKGRLSIKSITRLYQQRMPTYLDTADIVVNSDAGSPGQISAEIVTGLCHFKKVSEAGCSPGS